VAEIEYDPNRTARIALLHYADGEKTHILAPDGCGTRSYVIACMMHHSWESAARSATSSKGHQCGLDGCCAYSCHHTQRVGLQARSAMAYPDTWRISTICIEAL